MYVCFTNYTVNCYDELSDQVARISRKGVVVIVGDFNARSGVKKDCLIGGLSDSDTINDVLDRDVPLYGFEHVNDMQISTDDLVANDISLERENEDKGLNDYGNRLVQLSATCDLIILNGRAG